MRAAKLENSPRLRRVLTVLSDESEHSTLEIIQRARVCAVNSVVSELRRNGLDIKCTRRGDHWYYRLIREDVAAMPAKQDLFA